MDKNYILDRNLVLVVLLGKSPAIITETLWALASLPTPLIPSRVDIYTTSDCIDGWESFQKIHINECIKEIQKIANVQFDETEDIYFIPYIIGSDRSPLNDIRTKDENEKMSDFFFKEIRTLKQEKRKLLISIAGGRKTMSAMLHSVASILCSSDDKIYHVLTNPSDPRDLPRDFVFPKLLENGKYDVDLDLAEIPFIPLSEYLSTKDFIGIHSYKNFIEKLSSKLDATSFSVSMNLTERKIKIISNTANGEEFRDFEFNINYFSLISTLLRRAYEGKTDIDTPLSTFYINKNYSKDERSKLSPFYQDLLAERQRIKNSLLNKKNLSLDEQIELEDFENKSNKKYSVFKISDKLGEIRRTFKDHKKSLSENIIFKIIPKLNKSQSSLVNPKNITFEDY